MVTASAEGYSASRRTVSVEEGETKIVELELELDTEQHPPAGTAERPRTHDSTGGSTTSPLVYVGFGVAAVGVVVGSVSGWMSISKASSAKEHCVGNACTPEARDDLDASLTLATVSDVSFGAALVGAAVGVVALVSSGKRSPERVARAPRSIQPVMSPRFIGMAGSF